MRLPIYRNNFYSLSIGWGELIYILLLKINRKYYTCWVEETCGELILGDIVIVIRCNGVVSHPVMDWELVNHLHSYKVSQKQSCLYNYTFQRNQADCEAGLHQLE